MYNSLHTLILGKLELFAAYPLDIKLPSTVPSFAWVTATIPCINSRLTRLVFEIAVTVNRDLNAISWRDIDDFLDTREQFEDLKSVEVVFLDTVPVTVTRHPETLPGVDLREEIMKRMPMTVKRGLMRCSARGLRTCGKSLFLDKLERSLMIFAPFTRRPRLPRRSRLRFHQRSKCPGAGR